MKPAWQIDSTITQLYNKQEERSSTFQSKFITFDIPEHLLDEKEKSELIFQARAYVKASRSAIICVAFKEVVESSNVIYLKSQVKNHIEKLHMGYIKGDASTKTETKTPVEHSKRTTLKTQKENTEIHGFVMDKKLMDSLKNPQSLDDHTSGSQHFSMDEKLRKLLHSD